MLRQLTRQRIITLPLEIHHRVEPMLLDPGALEAEEERARIEEEETTGEEIEIGVIITIVRITLARKEIGLKIGANGQLEQREIKIVLKPEKEMEIIPRVMQQIHDKFDQERLC